MLHPLGENCKPKKGLFFRNRNNLIAFLLFQNKFIVNMDITSINSLILFVLCND